MGLSIKLSGSLARRSLSTTLTYQLKNISCSGQSKGTMLLLRHHVLKSSALLLVALLLSNCSVGNKKARILQRADNYFKAGDYEKAKVEYLNLLRVENQSPRALQQLGLIWMKQGAPLRGVPFLLKVRELAPDNTEARSHLAVALRALGNPSEARKEALAVLKRDPANSDAIVILADASSSKEEIPAAEQQLEKFTNKNTAAFHLAQASLSVPVIKHKVFASMDLQYVSRRVTLAGPYSGAYVVPNFTLFGRDISPTGPNHHTQLGFPVVLGAESLVEQDGIIRAHD